MIRILSDNDDLKAVCSVTEMAKKLGLSRARFYQLQKMGVFPVPIYCLRTKRPFYSFDLQQKCIEIRKTGIGNNGQIVLFYTSRQSTSKKSQNQPNPEYKELADILKQMGLNVTVNKVKTAVNALYPEGLAQQPVDGTFIRDLFRYFDRDCKNGV
ncbi:MAG: helix-turn-helix transcriptional regulator [Planctomycetota bacterium]|jgi:DNA-binding phage protein